MSSCFSSCHSKSFAPPHLFCSLADTLSNWHPRFFHLSYSEGNRGSWGQVNTCSWNSMQKLNSSVTATWWPDSILSQPGTLSLDSLLRASYAWLVRLNPYMIVREESLLVAPWLLYLVELGKQKLSAERKSKTPASACSVVCSALINCNIHLTPAIPWSHTIGCLNRVAK